MPGFQRQWPDRLLLCIGIRHGSAYQPLVEAKQGVVSSTQRHHCRTGQGCGIDDQRRTGLARQLQAVRQHQPPLGIGVDDLDRGAVLVGKDVPQLVGVAGDQVLGAAKDELHPLVEPAQRGQRQCAGHDGGAAHVTLHGEHPLGALHGVAT